MKFQACARKPIVKATNTFIELNGLNFQKLGCIPFFLMDRIPYFVIRHSLFVILFFDLLTDHATHKG